jgi:hypothetical protein
MEKYAKLSRQLFVEFKRELLAASNSYLAFGLMAITNGR